MSYTYALGTLYSLHTIIIYLLLSISELMAPINEIQQAV